MKFSSLTPAQQQQLARGSQMFQQLLIQQQYLIRQGLLIQSHPYYQAHAQALAQAQATLRAQLQQNVLRQQQVAAAMAATGQKIVNSAAATSSTAASSGTNSSVSVGAVSQSGNHAHQTASHSSSSATKTLTSSEVGTRTSSHGDGEVVSTSSHAPTTHQRTHSQQTTSSAKQSNNRTASSKAVKNGGSSHTPHSAQNTERKSARLKAKWLPFAFVRDEQCAAWVQCFVVLNMCYAVWTQKLHMLAVAISLSQIIACLLYCCVLPHVCIYLSFLLCSHCTLTAVDMICSKIFITCTAHVKQRSHTVKIMQECCFADLHAPNIRNVSLWVWTDNPYYTQPVDATRLSYVLFGNGRHEPGAQGTWRWVGSGDDPIDDEPRLLSQLAKSCQKWRLVL